MKELLKNRAIQIALIVLAGESIFVLPFVIPRIFRPTYLSSMELDNTQLGNCFAVYGIVALVSYLFGGSLADKFNSRYLMGIALILTSFGGFYLSTFPSYINLLILFGYWGFTTIFLFWAAMIKATRIWGGNEHQGKAFGILDGGRGLVGASMALFGVFLFTLATIQITTEITQAQKNIAFEEVLRNLSIIVLVIGIIILLLLRVESDKNSSKLKLNQVFSVLKIKSLWLIMIIILCGYVGYKSTDFIPQFAHEILGYTEAQSAQLGTLLLYVRPLVGISIGFVADKKGILNLLIFSFILTLLLSFLFGLGYHDFIFGIYLLSVIAFGVGVYALRALYFATLGIGNIPIALTGTAVGLISVIGYLPDIFHGPLTGYFLDNFEGITGYNFIFLTLASFSLIGLTATIIFKRS